jgi:hypothetical protein
MPVCSLVNSCITAEKGPRGDSGSATILPPVAFRSRSLASDAMELSANGDHNGNVNHTNRAIKWLPEETYLPVKLPGDSDRHFISSVAARFLCRDPFVHAGIEHIKWKCTGVDHEVVEFANVKLCSECLLRTFA